MSAIADFIRLPANVVEQLRSNYVETMQHHGSSAASYEWSGYVLSTLLAYLDEQGIRLMDSPYDALTAYLSASHDMTLFIFTPAHRDAYLGLLSPERFSADELRDYFNDFNATHGNNEQAMLDGISAIRQSLSLLDADSVLVCRIT